MSRTVTNVAPASQAYFGEAPAPAPVLPAGPAAHPVAAASWSPPQLRHALANLGPAQPASPDLHPEPAARTQPLGGVRRPLPPPAQAQTDTPGTAERLADAGEVVPAAVASLIAALPNPGPLAPAEARLDADEFARALAGVGLAPEPPMPAARLALEAMAEEHDERPPKIIERAQAERELRAGGQMASPVRPNPLPALAAGFACAMATGCALYAVLLLR